MTDPTADDAAADANDTESTERPAAQERNPPAPPPLRPWHLNGWIVG